MAGGGVALIGTTLVPLLSGLFGYTVMIWDEKDEQWFGVEHCKAPELLRDALLDGYRDFLEQQLTHNRRSLTETEILDIQNRCEQLYDLCGE